MQYVRICGVMWRCPLTFSEIDFHFEYVVWPTKPKWHSGALFCQGSICWSRHCLITIQLSCVYLWLTDHGGFPGLEDRASFFVIRHSLRWSILDSGWNRGNAHAPEILREHGLYTCLALADTRRAAFKAACLFLAGLFEVCLLKAVC